MKRTLPLILTLLCISAAPYSPTTDYEKRTIEGWNILIHKDLIARDELCAKVQELLRVKLYDIQRVVPAPAVVELKKVPIWLELKDTAPPCACFHPSAEWLKENGYNPDKAGAVEIGNAENFLTWTVDQPWMVLHELAHAYHHRVMGADNADIKAAYRAAKASGKYDSVMRINGKKEKHYAMNNDEEYFAEATEAYFGANDFYPFVRGELREFDSTGYEMIKKVWGVGNKK